MQDSELPAWLMCEDVFNKIKTELITEAMDTLQEAIDSKAIEISGSLINLPDKPSDTDMHMFIINKLLAEKDGIMERYRHYLDSDYDVKEDHKEILKRERLRKFLFAVDQISLLMGYSALMDSWIHDVAMQVSVKSLTEIIKNTMDGNNQRAELLAYVLNNKKIEIEGILAKDERDALRSALD